MPAGAPGAPPAEGEPQGTPDAIQHFCKDDPIAISRELDCDETRPRNVVCRRVPQP
jgi:hypothetical protein